MARKAKDTRGDNGRVTGQNSYSGNRLKWVDGYLNAEDKQWLDDHRNEVAEFILKLVDEQANGYKISCKYSVESSRYQASLLPDDPDCINAGYGLSHRANDPTVALFVLSYKHFIKFDGKWAETEIGSRDSGDWE
jgi:hypothetical protein